MSRGRIFRFGGAFVILIVVATAALTQYEWSIRHWSLLTLPITLFVCLVFGLNWFSLAFTFVMSLFMLFDWPEGNMIPTPTTDMGNWLFLMTFVLSIRLLLHSTIFDHELVSRTFVLADAFLLPATFGFYVFLATQDFSFFRMLWSLYILITGANLIRLFSPETTRRTKVIGVLASIVTFVALQNLHYIISFAETYLYGSLGNRSGVSSVVAAEREMVEIEFTEIEAGKYDLPSLRDGTCTGKNSYGPLRLLYDEGVTLEVVPDPSGGATVKIQWNGDPVPLEAGLYHGQRVVAGNWVVVGCTDHIELHQNLEGQILAGGKNGQRENW